MKKKEIIKSLDILGESIRKIKIDVKWQADVSRKAMRDIELQNNARYGKKEIVGKLDLLETAIDILIQDTKRLRARVEKQKEISDRQEKINKLLCDKLGVKAIYSPAALNLVSTHGL